ncbi:MAG: leucyl/phenylalanyl-tRNA--protein transferase [Ignavibacteriaceae bacterium]
MAESNSSQEEVLLIPEQMIKLYAMGAFPMADSSTGKIEWFFPEVRTIIPLNDFRIPRSLKKILIENRFKVAYDTDFLSVVHHCAARKETWISGTLIEAYLNLQKLGHIHTVEVYEDEKLLGGLYGVSFKGAFFGESMFSLVSQASKVALAHLLNRLREKNFVVLDVQYMTEHLKMFGAKEISFEAFSSLLCQASLVDAEF